MLRYALASIWTEAEYGIHALGICNCQAIANEALEMTAQFAKPKDLTDDGKGYEGWRNKYSKELGDSLILQLLKEEAKAQLLKEEAEAQYFKEHNVAGT